MIRNLKTILHPCLTGTNAPHCVRIGAERLNQTISIEKASASLFMASYARRSGDVTLDPSASTDCLLIIYRLLLLLRALCFLRGPHPSRRSWTIRRTTSAVSERERPLRTCGSAKKQLEKVTARCWKGCTQGRSEGGSGLSTRLRCAFAFFLR